MTTRAAFVATLVWKVSSASRAVSTTCASGAGAVTRSSGSCPKTTSPSSTAHTSPVKRNRGRISSKKRTGADWIAGTVRSQAISSAVKRRCSR